jgi:hypothetical protein
MLDFLRATLLEWEKRALDALAIDVAAVTDPNYQHDNALATTR